MVGHQGGWGWRTKVLGKRGRKAMTAFTPIGQQGAVQAVFPGKHGAPPYHRLPTAGNQIPNNLTLFEYFIPDGMDHLGIRLRDIFDMPLGPDAPALVRFQR